MKPKQILVSLLPILLTSFLSGVVYEDGNTNDTSRWIAINGDMSSISNMEDSLTANNRVIHTSNIRIQYKLDIDYSSFYTDKKLSFRMLNPSSDYAFYIHLNTDNGLRIIKYSNRKQEHRILVGNRTKVGIANSIIQGVWNDISLDFASDLARVEPSNTINSVEAFIIRGVLSIDDIKMIGTQVVTNHIPIADSARDQNVETSTQVQLSGDLSSDIDGDPLTYRWRMKSKPNGSIAVLSDTTIDNPTFVADLEGEYMIELIVNDGQVDSLPNDVKIIVSDNSSY